jgi:hypothetical protein
MTSEPSRRISSFSTPTAVSIESLRSEFEHTSSAKSAVWCASVILTGRISISRTPMPRRASCQAASLPASPAPTTVTCMSFMAEMRRKVDRVVFRRSCKPRQIGYTKISDIRCRSGVSSFDY